MMQRKGVRTWLAAAGVAGLVGVGVSGTAHADGIGRFVEHDLVSDVAGRADLTDTEPGQRVGHRPGPDQPGLGGRQRHERGDALHGRRRRPAADQGPAHRRACPATASTGQVFNATTGFVVTTAHGHTGPALFIFDSESGDITGLEPRRCRHRRRRPRRSGPST